MARAKRTDRAEARRQHRERLREEMEALAAAEETGEAEDPAIGVGKMKSAHDRPSRSGEFANPVGRMGMAASAKAAFRQPTYIDDLKNLRTLIFKSYAVWPIFVIVAAAALFCFARVNKDTTVDNDPVIAISLQFILVPIPTLMPMLAGYLAPRATWLAGALAGGIGTSGYVALVIGANLKVVGSARIDSPGIIIEAVLASAALGALLGAASGWYKRFLNGMQAGRPKPSRPAGSQRAAAARRGKPAGR